MTHEPSNEVIEAALKAYWERPMTNEHHFRMRAALITAANTQEPAHVPPEAREIVKKVRRIVFSGPFHDRLKLAMSADEAAALIQSAIDKARAEANNERDEFGALFVQMRARAEAAERERDDYKDAAASEADRVNELTRDFAALRAKAEKLAEALEPFAVLRAMRLMTNGIRYDFRIDVTHVRRAQAVLAEWKGG